MKNKIIIGSIVIIITLSSLIIFKEDKKDKLLTNTENLISYTIDGTRAKEKPSKSLGYLANKIACENNSNIVWDNDNWQVELKAEKEDRCTVDFTKNISTQGYRITIVPSVTNGIDSTSKSTINGGTITIHPKDGYVLTGVSGCSGVIQNNKLIINNVTSNQTCNLTVRETLRGKILTNNNWTTATERTDFNTIETTTKLWKSEDDQGTTYYFTGNPNNWVSFAGSLWRIIRINGNGSVRLLYAGVGDENGYISTSKFNNTINHPAYEGWKYTVGGSAELDRGNTEKSTAYIEVENWYNNLSEENKGYIDKNAIYCNNRKIEKGSYGISNIINYGWQRLLTTKNNTYFCENEKDRFYTFGLITADEIVYAGGKGDEFDEDGPLSPNTSAYYYLNTSGGSITGSKGWWTMTPSVYWKSGTTDGTARLFNVGNKGALSWRTNANIELAIRPVISLKSCVTIIDNGTGTATNPYVVNGTC